MKLIYNEKCFINVDASFPRKKLSLYLDGIKTVLDFSDGEPKINIPVYNVREVMFEKQFARFIKFSNVRTISEEVEERYEQLGILKRDDIFYRELSKGPSEKVLFVFSENLTYIEQSTPYFEDLIEEKLKIVQVFDEYLQNGSDYLIANDGKPLVDKMSKFIDKYVQEFGLSNLSFLGIKSGALAASLYGNLCACPNIINFNSQDDALKDAQKRTILSDYKFTMENTVEVTSFPPEELEKVQEEAKYLLTNDTKQTIKGQTFLAIALAKSLIGFKEKNYGRIIHFSGQVGKIEQTNDRLLMAFLLDDKRIRPLECIRSMGKQGVLCDRSQIENQVIVTINENSINYYERVDFDD